MGCFVPVHALTLPGFAAVWTCSAGRQERGGTARSRQYVLQPVDGQARYTRRGAGVQAKGGCFDSVEGCKLSALRCST